MGSQANGKHKRILDPGLSHFVLSGVKHFKRAFLNAVQFPIEIYDRILSVYGMYESLCSIAQVISHVLQQDDRSPNL